MNSTGRMPNRPRRFLHESEGEEYLHKEAWRVVMRQFKRPDDPKKGALYDDLVAMVFMSHSLEGYLNFLGDKILPEVWKDERDIEDGIEGKLALILKACDLPTFEKGRRPYATVKALNKLRDSIAHPKTHKPKTSKIYPEGKEPPLFPTTYLETLVSHDKAERAQNDVRAIVDCIHAAAVTKFPDLRLGHDGLGGIISQHSGGARLHEE